MKTAEKNKMFYDAHAHLYEAADGNRGYYPEGRIQKFCSLPITKRIFGGRTFTPGQGITVDQVPAHTHSCALFGCDAFLDLCAGTGYVARAVADMGRFKMVVAYDISEKMLDMIQDKRIDKVVGPAEKMPFAGELFDKVVCFAGLHHVEAYRPVFDEVYRVLKPGGEFFTDQDIDRLFVRRWYWPLQLYRAWRNPAGRFNTDQKTYAAVEVHHNGVDALGMKEYLLKLGFDVEVTWHWGDYKPCRHGLAPYVSIWARKPFEK